MPTIHPSALVSDQARLADDVEIGPGCVVDGTVTLGAGVRLIAQAYLRGPLTVGEGTVIWPGACLGAPPQDYKFGPDATSAGVVMGAGCIVREHATVHAATSEETPTTIGDRVFLMVGSHAGHDAWVGDDVIMVNGAGLAGHSRIERNATIAASALVHQFCRVGRLAFMSAGTAVSGDVPPFCIVHERQLLGGLNLVGMRRAGMSSEEITESRRAFRLAFRTRATRSEMQAILDEIGANCPPVAEMADFVRAAKRPVVTALARASRAGVGA